MRRSNNICRALALAILLGGMLAACSEYLDHRVTLSSSSGDAVETNKVTQIIDPWPPASADRNIAYNGQRMQAAVERYRNDKVTPPQGIGTSNSYTPPSAPSNSGSGNNTTPVGPTVTQTPATP